MYKVFQWASGGVGKQTARAVLERDFGFMDNGGIATAMQMVNAIDYVVDAPAGIQTMQTCLPSFVGFQGC